MGVRQRLEDKIRRKEQELQELEAQVRDGRNYLQGLQDTLKMLPREDVGTGNESEGVTLRANSGPAMAQAYLNRVGRPKHIADILRGIGKDVNRKNRTSLAGSLNMYARQGIIFTAEGSNVFGLIGMQKEEKQPTGPPKNFGLIHPQSDEDDDPSLSDLM